MYTNLDIDKSPVGLEMSCYATVVSSNTSNVAFFPSYAT
jgi:hypothetical protein